MLEVEQIDACLKPRFAALKQELVNLHMPTEVEMRLLQSFVLQHPPAPWWHKLFSEPWQWSGVLTMAVLVVLVFARQPSMDDVHSYPQFAAVLNSIAPIQPERDAYEEIPFVALDSGENILKQDNMRIVQAQIPHTMLASLGVPVSPQAAGDYATAEMLVGENDEYLAMRFVPGE